MSGMKRLRGVFRPFMMLVGNSGVPFIVCTPKSMRPENVHLPSWQLIWLLLHPLLALDAVRLTFRGSLGGALPTVLQSALNPLSFTSSSKTRTGSCGLIKRNLRRSVQRHPDVDSSNQTSSLVVFQRTPLRRYVPLASGPGLPLSRDADPRCMAARPHTPSVLVVLPDFDGLLRKWPRRFVAPYNRPWGSSRFRHNLPHTALLRRLVPRAFPRLAYHTLRSVSLCNSLHVSPQSLPSCRCLPPLFPAGAHPTTRLFSITKSVTPSRRCHRYVVRCSLGLCSPSRFSPQS